MRTTFRNLLAVIVLLSVTLSVRAAVVEHYLDRTNLGLAGQENWGYYNSVDAPQGAYYGAMVSGVTSITGRVTLASALQPGAYSFYFKGYDYDKYNTGVVRVAGVSAELQTSDRDADGQWTGPFRLTLPSATNGVDLILKKNVSPDTYVQFLMIAFYVTSDTNTLVFKNDDVTSFRYPSVSEYDTRAPVKGNLVQNSSFELGMGFGWGLEQTGTTRFKDALRDVWDTTNGYHGSCSVRLPCTNLLSMISRPILLKSNKLHTASVYYKTTHADYVWLHLINTVTPPAGLPAAQTNTVGVLATPGSWQRLVLTNVMLHYPASEFHMVLQTQMQSSGGAGFVWFDGLQIEEGEISAYAPKPIEAAVITNQVAGIYYEGESLAPTLRVYNGTASTITTNLDWEILDFKNNRLTNGTLAVVAPANSATNRSFSLNVGRRGIFRLNTWIRNMEGTDEEMIFSIIAPPADMDQDLDSILGTATDAAAWQMKIMNRSGMKWNRFLSPGAWFRWSLTEPTQGAFVYYDEYATTWTNFGTVVMGNIGEHSPSWAIRTYFTLSGVTGTFVKGERIYSGVNTGGVTVALTAAAHATRDALQITNVAGVFLNGNSITGQTSGARATISSVPFTLSPDLDGWSNMVYNVVRHYTNYVRSWEIWNEPNQSGYIASTDYYAEMLRRAMIIIKNIDTNLLVIAMGGTLATSYPQAVIDALSVIVPSWTNYVDAISYHAYQITAQSGQIADSYRTAFKQVYGIPFWNTETGLWELGFYAGANGNVRTGLRNLIRWQDAYRFYSGTLGIAEDIAINFLQSIGGGASKYFHYDARIRAVPNYYLVHPTMIEYDDTLRAKGIMFASLGALIEHSTGLGRLTMPSSNVEAYSLLKAGVPMAVLWTTNKRGNNVTLAGGVTASQFKLYDLMGNEETLANVSIRANRTPKLLVGQGGISTNTFYTALTSSTITNQADLVAPSLAITVGPRGTLTNTNYIRFRWFAIDDTSLPSITSFEAVLYSWFLDGVDSDWSAWSQDTRATYAWPNDVGTYYFMVRAMDEAGNVSSNQTRQFAIMQEDVPEEPPEEPPPGPGGQLGARRGRTRYPLGGFP